MENSQFVSYEDFKKMNIRVGTVRHIEPVEGTDKLLRCGVDFNEIDEEGNQVLRQIVSGIREYYPDYETLIGRQLLYIINLEPRTICGVTSYGMLLAVDGEEGNPVFLIPAENVPAGVSVR